MSGGDSVRAELLFYKEKKMSRQVEFFVDSI